MKINETSSTYSPNARPYKHVQMIDDTIDEFTIPSINASPEIYLKHQLNNQMSDISPYNRKKQHQKNNLSLQKQQSQNEFKRFEEKLNVIKVQKRSIKLPDTYVNGLPDLFEPYKQAHQQFQWFKKDRKSYRDADILNLEPVQSVQLSEAFHSENPNNKEFLKSTKMKNKDLMIVDNKKRSRSLMRDRKSPIASIDTDQRSINDITAMRTKQNYEIFKSKMEGKYREESMEVKRRPTGQASNFIVQLPDINDKSPKSRFEFELTLSQERRYQGRQKYRKTLDIRNAQILNPSQPSRNHNTINSGNSPLIVGKKKQLTKPGKDNIQIVEGGGTQSHEGQSRWYSFQNQPLTTFTKRNSKNENNFLTIKQLTREQNNTMIEHNDKLDERVQSEATTSMRQGASSQLDNNKLQGQESVHTLQLGKESALGNVNITSPDYQHSVFTKNETSQKTKRGTASNTNYMKLGNKNQDIANVMQHSCLRIGVYEPLQKKSPKQFNKKSNPNVLNQNAKRDAQVSILQSDEYDAYMRSGGSTSTKHFHTTKQSTIEYKAVPMSQVDLLPQNEGQLSHADSKVNNSLGSSTKIQAHMFGSTKSNLKIQENSQGNSSTMQHYGKKSPSPNSGQRKDITPEQDFVLKMPFTNYLSHQMHESYMKKVRDIQRKNSQDRKDEGSVDRREQGTLVLNSIYLSPSGTQDKSQSKRTTKNMFMVNKENAIIERTLDGGTNSKESLLEKTQQKTVPLYTPTGHMDDSSANDPLTKSQVSKSKSPGKTSDLKTALMLFNNSPEIAVETQERKLSSKNLGADTFETRNDSQELLQKGKRISMKSSETNNKAKKWNIKNIPNEQIDIVKVNPDQANQVTLTQDSFSQRQQCKSQLTQHTTMRMPGKIKIKKSEGKINPSITQMKQIQTKPSTTLNESLQVDMEDTYEEDEPDFARFTQTVLPNGSIINCSQKVKRIIEQALEETIRNQQLQKRNNNKRSRSPRAQSKLSDTLIITKENSEQKPEPEKVAIIVNKFLRLAYKEKTEIEQPYTQIVLPDDTPVRNLEDIRKFLSEQTGSKPCHLILLKEDQEYLQDVAQLREIALDSLKMSLYKKNEERRSEYESKRRLIEQISWIQEAIQSEQSNSDFVAKIQLQLNQNNELEYPRGSMMNRHSGMSLAEGHISIQDSSAHGKQSDMRKNENKSHIMHIKPQQIHVVPIHIKQPLSIKPDGRYINNKFPYVSSTPAAGNESSNLSSQITLNIQSLPDNIIQTQGRISESMIYNSYNNESSNVNNQPPQQHLRQIGELHLDSQNGMGQNQGANSNHPSIMLMQNTQLSDMDPGQSNYINTENQVTIKRKPKNQRSNSYMTVDHYDVMQQPILIQESLEVSQGDSFVTGARSPIYNVGLYDPQKQPTSTQNVFGANNDNMKGPGTVFSCLNRRRYQRNLQQEINTLEKKMKKDKVDNPLNDRLFFSNKRGSLQQHLNQKHQLFRELKILSRKSKNLKNRLQNGAGSQQIATTQSNSPVGALSPPMLDTGLNTQQLNSNQQQAFHIPIEMIDEEDGPQEVHHQLVIPADLNEKMEELLIEEQMNPVEMIRMRSHVQLKDMKETIGADKDDKEAVKQFSYIPQMMHNDLGIVSKNYHQYFSPQESGVNTKEMSHSGKLEGFQITEHPTGKTSPALGQFQQSPQHNISKAHIRHSPQNTNQTSADFSSCSFDAKLSQPSKGKILQFLEYKNKLQPVKLK